MCCASAWCRRCSERSSWALVISTSAAPCAPEPSYEANEAGFPRREAKLGFPLIALGTILQLVGLFAS